jgi:hypothetical protein
MKDRCYNPKNIRYQCYGGRGITICEEWLAPYYGYKNFKKWALSHGYRDDLSIDRIDVNKGNGAAWFTTTTGEAIEADTIIKWERLQTQQELEF